MAKLEANDPLAVEFANPGNTKIENPIFNKTFSVENTLNKRLDIRAC